MSTKCPCCSSVLLRHWRHNKVYWFCCHCRQEMPNLEAIACQSRYQKRKQTLTKKLSFSNQFVALNPAPKCLEKQL